MRNGYLPDYQTDLKKIRAQYYSKYPGIWISIQEKEIEGGAVALRIKKSEVRKSLLFGFAGYKILCKLTNILEKIS